MTEKELRKLNRAKLLELLLEQTKRAEKLADENTRLKERITDRERQLAQTGELIDAAVKLSGRREDGAASRALSEALRTAVPPDEGEAAPAQDEDVPEDDDEPPERDMPTAEQLERALTRERYRRKYTWSVKSTIYALVTVAAVSVLVAVLLLPVLQIYGTSMQPTLSEGNFVVSVKGGSLETGDVVAFYYNNRILVKRVIGQPGQWIDIDPDGTVYVDNVAIQEPYLTAKAFGDCDIELPYQVPESRVFVMGDNRGTSVDSRSTTVGCVAEEQLVGRIVFRVWPLAEVGKI